MKKLLIGFVATITLLSVIACFFVYYWLYQDEDASVNIAENAIARDGLVFIGHVNTKKIISLYKLKYGESDPAPIPSMMIDTSLINLLFTGKNNLGDQVDQVIFGYRVADKGNGSMNLILNGNIDIDDFKAALAKKYSIAEKDSNSFIITELPKATLIKNEAEFDCPDDEPKTEHKKPLMSFSLVHSGPWLIGAADINDAKAILQRVEIQAKADVNIDRWRHFRKGKLFSLGMLDAEKSKRSPLAMLDMLMPRSKDKNKKTNPFTEAYIGAEINLASRSLLITSDIIAEPSWTKAQATEFNAKKIKFVDSVKDFSKTLAGLAENLTITDEGEVLHAAVNIPQDLINKIPEIFSEAISSMFSMAFGGMSSSVKSSKSDSEEKTKIEDQIDDRVWDYSFNNKFTGLPDFKPDQHFLPKQINGAFGYDLEKVSFNKDYGLIEVDFSSKTNLPELKEGYWADSGMTYLLWVEDAMDAEGKSLLRDERCLKDLTNFDKKNQSPERLFNNINNTAEATKKFRLNKDARFESLKTITGRVEVSMPIKVKNKRMIAKVGETVEMEGVRIYIKKVDRDAISLEISGDIEKVIEIRGINKAGKPLRSNGSSSSGFLGKQDKHVSFGGNVKKLDIFIATAYTTLKDNFIFDVTAAMTSGRSDNIKYDLLEKPDTVNRASWNAFNNVDAEEFNTSVNRDTWSKWIGQYTKVPIDVRVEHDKNSKWYYTPKIKVTVPMLHRLVNNYNFVEVILKSKVEIEPAITKPFLFNPSVYSTNNIAAYGRDFLVDEKPFTSHNESVDLGYKQGEVIDSISGIITVRLPQAISKQKIDFPVFDKPTLIDQHQITLKEIDFGFSKAFKLEYNGPLDKFISILTVTDTGEIYNPVKFEAIKDGVVIHTPLYKNISHLLLLTADKQETIAYPFKIKTDYSIYENKKLK